MFPKVLLTMISTGSDKGLASQQVTNVNHYLNPNGLLPTGLPATLNCLPIPQRPRDAMITSLWCQDDVKTSFWRKNYVILALSARWGTILYCTYERMMMWCTGAYMRHSVRFFYANANVYEYVRICGLHLCASVPLSFLYRPSLYVSLRNRA